MSKVSRLKPKPCSKRLIKPVKPAKAFKKVDKKVDKKHENDNGKNDKKIKTLEVKSKITDYFNKASSKTIPDEATVAKYSEVEKEVDPSQAELQSLAPASSIGDRIVPGIGTPSTRAAFVQCVVTNHQNRVISRDQITASYRRCNGVHLAPIFSLFKQAGASGSAEPREINSSDDVQVRPENI